jgi:hypothetical protein
MENLKIYTLLMLHFLYFLPAGHPALALDGFRTTTKNKARILIFLSVVCNFFRVFPY